METNPNVIEFPSLTNPDAWEDHVPFDELSTPDIPASLLPGVFGEFTKALAQTTETAESLSVMVVLGIISTIIAKRFSVSPKAGWYEPVNIYTMIALPPANHKTVVLNTCTKPFVDWEKEQALLHGAEIKRQYSERKTQEKIIEALRNKVAKIDDHNEQQQLINEIADKEAVLIDPPSLPQLFTNDVTPESLAALVHEQQGRLAIFSDEGGILETLAGLYSQGNANIDILLKGIDGGEVRIRRKDRNISINPYLTIVLAIQPIILQNLAVKRAYMGNGTLERFLYVLPKSQLGYRTHDKPTLTFGLLGAYHDEINKLLNRYVVSNEPQILTLDPLAQQRWRLFQHHIETQLKPEGRLASCLGWGGKICGFVLRIAALLHVAKGNQPNNLVIEASTMQNAITIMELLTDHALAAFGLMGADQATEDAKVIYQWLKIRNQPSFTQSEILLAMRNKKLGRLERLQKALQILIAHHLISAPIKIPSRKPTTLYYVHPNILANGTKYE